VLSRTLELARELAPYQLHGCIPGAGARRFAADEVKGDGVQLDPTRSRWISPVAASPWRSCRRSCSSVQYPGGEITSTHSLCCSPSHDSQQGVAALRRPDAHLREGRARAVSTRPGCAALHPSRYLPRDAFYCGGEHVALLDERDSINKTCWDGGGGPDRSLPPASGAGSGPVITEDHPVLVALLRSQKRWRSTHRVRRLSACLRC